MATIDIPNVQRAAVLTEEYGKPHTFRTDFPVTLPNSGQILVKLQASGVCSGDVNPRDGYPPAPKVAHRPLVTGHEGVGIVVAVGSDVTEFAVGDRVGMGWRSEVCRSCGECTRGEDNLCQSQKMNGYDSNGTFQGEYEHRILVRVHLPRSFVRQTLQVFLNLHLTEMLLTSLSTTLSSRVRQHLYRFAHPYPTHYDSRHAHCTPSLRWRHCTGGCPSYRRNHTGKMGLRDGCRRWRWCPRLPLRPAFGPQGCRHRQRTEGGHL